MCIRDSGGTVLCESETGLVLPAQVGGLTLQKQYKYGKVLLWKYTCLLYTSGSSCTARRASCSASMLLPRP